MVASTMGTGLDEKAIGDVLGKLVEGNAVEASALLANALVFDDRQTQRSPPGVAEPVWQREEPT